MMLHPDVLSGEQLVLGVDVSADGALAWTVRRPAPDWHGYAVQLWYQAAAGAPAARVATRQPIVGVPRFDGTGAAVVVTAGEPAQAWRIVLDGSGESLLTRLEHGVSQAAPAPSGDALAVIAPWGEPCGMVGDPRSPTARHVGSLRFAADGIGIRDYRSRLLLIHGDRITPLDAGDYDIEACGWSPDGARLWYAAYGGDRKAVGASRLWAVEARAGARPRLLAEGPGSIVDASWSGDGRIAYATHPAGDSTAAQLIVADADGANARRIDGGLCAEHVGLLDTLPVAGSEIGELCWNQSAGALLALVTHRSRIRLYSFSASQVPAHQPQPAVVADGLTPAAIRASGSHVALVGSRGRAADVYRLAGGRATQVSSHGSWLPAGCWPVPRSVTVPAGSGSVHAWLFEPSNGGSGPLPLVLHIHGGPHQAHIELAWLEIVLMTAHGYRVLCPDPTGSLGYGDEHSTRIHDPEREPDLADLISCIDFAIDREIADPERIAVMGMSYGGAATLRMLAADSRLAAGVAENPFANLVSSLATTDIAGSIDALLGYSPDTTDLAGLLARSPIAGLGRMTAPLLLLHAEGDLRCPISESEQVFTRLRALGRTVEFVRFPAESHLMFHFGRPDRRRYRLQLILDWLDRYLARGGPGLGERESHDSQAPSSRAG